MKRKFDNFDALYYLWAFMNDGVDYIDDITGGDYVIGSENEKRLRYAREHMKQACLALFPVAYNGLEKKYDLNAS